jgi:hypothetical protein
VNGPPGSEDIRIFIARLPVHHFKFCLLIFKNTKD